MKKKLLLSVLCLLPFLSKSQVTLTAAQAPPAGSIFIYNDANVPSPAFSYGTSGTNNVWDFTGIFAVPGADDTTYVVSPSSIPLAAAFPSATHCTYEDGGGDIGVLRVDNSGVHNLGIITDPFGSYIPLSFNPEVNSLPFPFSYPNSLTGVTYLELYASGAQIGQPSLDSARSKSSVYVQADVIASGTIIVPSGSFPSILRREINNQVDSIWIKGAITGGTWVLSGPPTVTVDSSFYWYTNNSIMPYAHALYDDTGLHDVNYFKELVTGIPVTAVNSDFSVYPNPATDVLKVKGLISGMTYDIKIFNAAGQLAMEGVTTMSQVNISFLPAGIYSIQLSDIKGNVMMKKFIKN